MVGVLTADGQARYVRDMRVTIWELNETNDYMSAVEEVVGSELELMTNELELAASGSKWTSQQAVISEDDA